MFILLSLSLERKVYGTPLNNELERKVHRVGQRKRC